MKLKYRTEIETSEYWTGTSYKCYRIIIEPVKKKFEQMLIGRGGYSYLIRNVSNNYTTFRGHSCPPLLRLNREVENVIEIYNKREFKRIQMILDLFNEKNKISIVVCCGLILCKKCKRNPRKSVEF